MKREEAIAYFKRHLDLYCVDGISREAEEMAIKALEQQPCEDAISRKAVIEHICESKDCYKKNCKGILYNRCPDIEWVNELPSVTPQEPILDKIRAEIEGLAYSWCELPETVIDDVLQIIDKYKESEEVCI